MNSIVRIMPDAIADFSSDFRAAMRHLAGGVSVITVGRGDEISGMTVSSVSSLALDPASLIVSVNRGTSSWPVLARERVFGVNILAADQLAVAERFAGKGGEKGAARFAGADWRRRVSGVPLLVGRAGGDRLRGRGDHRTAFSCDRDRPCAASRRRATCRRAGLLAGRLCRCRARRGHAPARRLERAGSKAGAKGLIAGLRWAPAWGWSLPA